MFLLMEATVLCTENKSFCKVLQDKSDSSFLHLLSLVFNYKSRVQKAAFPMLENGNSVY